MCIKTDVNTENKVILERLNHTQKADNDDSESAAFRKNDSVGFKLPSIKSSLNIDWPHEQINTVNNSMQTDKLLVARK